MSRLPLRVALCAALLLGAAARPAAALWPADPTVNVPVCTALGDQAILANVTDDAGGAIVFWFENSATPSGVPYVVHAQHVLARGSVDPAWPAGGLLVTSAMTSDGSSRPRALPDEAGGALFVLFEVQGLSTSVRVHHVLASGELDPAWPVGGAVPCVTSYAKEALGAVSDGAGGVVVTWIETRLRTSQLLPGVYAAHVTAAGEVDPAWTYNGARVFESPQGPLAQAAPASDGAGGAIVVWTYLVVPAQGTDLYARRVRADGTMDPAWPSIGRSVCAQAGDQDLPAIVSDGSGGAVVAWRDARNGVHRDLFAHHLFANGQLDPAWPLAGRALCTATGDQAIDALVEDGAGGALAVFADLRSGPAQDLYAQHVLAGGALDPAWPADGLAVCTAAGDQRVATAIPDGAGGALVAWEDGRPGTHTDVYAQHVLGTGANDPAWTADGVGLALLGSSQYRPVLVSDGEGGGLVAFTDTRGPATTAGFGAAATFSTDVYASRIERHGYVGSPGTEIASVADVGYDQGGLVRITWPASPLDLANDPNVAAYDLERWNGGAWVREQVVAADHVSAQYGANAAAPTGGPAPPELQAVFRVVARNASETVAWPSPADSGYALDNLAPERPNGASGEYVPGGAALHWLPGAESDLAGYRVYRGIHSGFVPGPENFVTERSDTGYVDDYDGPGIYKISAFDVHGNESTMRTIEPTGTPTTGVAPSTGTAFAAPLPNPATRGVRLAYSLAHAAPVRLAIVDAAGRTVRVLADGERAAGAHAVTWDLRDGSGARVAPGLYFAQFTADGMRAVRRIVALR